MTKCEIIKQLIKLNPQLHMKPLWSRDNDYLINLLNNSKKGVRYKNKPTRKYEISKNKY